MIFGVLTYNRKQEAEWVFDSILPGIVPDHVMEMLSVEFAFDMGLCDECSMASHCHVIEWPGGRKFCTVLFHDSVKPEWKMKDVA